MGQLESLTVAALGRSPYEDQVVQNQEGEDSGSSAQQYTENGHPSNPETKRRIRDHVRASNEVMQVTGVVEESSAIKAKEKALKAEHQRETLVGMRLLEVGRATLIGGVWGVLGLRRRILLYKPYAEISFLGLLRRETGLYSASQFVFAGIPTVVAYHISDWLGFVWQASFEGLFNDGGGVFSDENHLSQRHLRLKHTLQTLFEVGFCYITLHFRMFAILQQLNLIPSNRLFPTLRSFIPFSAGSPLEFPAPPSLTLGSAVSWLSALIWSAAPMGVIFVHAKAKFIVAHILYQLIYKSLPRPTGSRVSLGTSPTPQDYDSGDAPIEPIQTWRGEDERTLRALEGLPSLDNLDTRTQVDIDHDSSDDEEGEITHATLISFDVEATEAVETSMGTWSAELRSANEPRLSKNIEYRVTTLTMLPSILATEGLREIVAGIIILPLEGIMVRIIGRAYRESAGLGVSDMYPVIGPRTPGIGNLLSSFALQLVVTGVVLVGATYTAQLFSNPTSEKLEEGA